MRNLDCLIFEYLDSVWIFFYIYHFSKKKIDDLVIIKPEIIEDEKGLALPIPGTKAASELASQSSLTNEEEMDELSFVGELEKHEEKEQENTTIIGIVAVAIIASVVGGVVFKLKKN